VYSCLVFVDINECQHPLQYPCYGICSNTVGGYSCSCATGTRSKDPKTSVCSPDAASERAKLTKLLIGNYLYSKNFSTVIRMG
jgi:hypothetical protein